MLCARIFSNSTQYPSSTSSPMQPRDAQRLQLTAHSVQRGSVPLKDGGGRRDGEWDDDDDGTADDDVDEKVAELSEASFEDDVEDAVASISSI